MMSSLKSGSDKIFTLLLEPFIRPSKINFRWTKFLNIKRKRFKDNFEAVKCVRENFTTHI